GRASSSFLCFDTRLEGFHQVLCRLDLGNSQLDNFFFALHLRFDELHQRFLVPVAVFFEVEGFLHYFDELTSELKLLLFNLGWFLEFGNVSRGTDLVCVVWGCYAICSFIQSL